MSRIELTSPVQPLAEPQRSWGEWLAWIATEDHCEWANRYVHWLKTPLGILAIGAVCALLCGLFVAPQGYVLLAAITSVIAVGLVWPLVAVRGVRCRFVFEASRGREGQASTAKLIVTNRWPWPVWGLAVNDPLLSGDRDSSLALARVEGWSTSTFNCSLTPAQRGVYPTREVRVGTGFPFGLYQASRPAETPRRLIVWPQTFRLPPLGAATGRSHWRGAASDRLAGSEGARLGVREHRVGDSLRDVHWAKSARYDRLIVSERESTIVEDATVFVGADPQDQTGTPPFEWRLRIAASICESFLANHGRVDLWLGGTKFSAGGGPADLERLLDEVAKHDPSNSVATNQAPAGNATGVVITIETSGKAIVLRRPNFGVATRGSDAHGPGWIEVDSSGDVPEQVRRGWRHTRRRVGRAG